MNSISEREKNLTNSELPVDAISSCRDESGYVPTVGRWGSEWPSWLATEERDWLRDNGGQRWPFGHPLPLPLWGEPRDALTLPTVEAYEELALTVELTVQQLLQAHNYNSVGNLIRYSYNYINPKLILYLFTFTKSCWSRNALNVCRTWLQLG